jgi:hypothetical protein
MPATGIARILLDRAGQPEANRLETSVNAGGAQAAIGRMAHGPGGRPAIAAPLDILRRLVDIECEPPVTYDLR